jgi:hypothetical protein
MSRKRACEICGALTGVLSNMDAGDRRIVLCKEHAAEAKTAAARSAEALRALFVEAEGRRALLSRRAEDERRTFPPRPEGRRMQRGRRESDLATPRDDGAAQRERRPG